MATIKSLEEKAKRYDEAIKRAKELLEVGLKDTRDKRVVLSFFPELAESDDEKIINNIKKVIGWYRGMFTEKSLMPEEYQEIDAWLEKQGEPVEINPTEFDTRLQTLIGKFDSLPKEEFIGSLSFWLNVVQNNGTYKPAKKQGKQETFCDKCKKAQPSHSCQDITELGRCAVEHEQKSTDKVEPKFKVGDWIVRELDNTCYQIKKHILNVTTNKYGYDLTNGGYISSQDANFYHLWTIQDAKDGDVLSWDDSKCIALFKNIYDKESFNSYGFLGHCTGTFELRMSYHDIEGVHPATKEQRETLKKAMADAGWEFDFDKKELKKIGQKPIKVPKFKVGDFIQFNGMGHTRYTIKEVCGLSHYINTCNKRMDMSYTDANFELVEQKPAEWSEEDEKHIHSIISTIECNRETYKQSKVITDSYTSDLEWFKSLINRCKLSNDFPH